jgi:hypothetical protein
MKKFLIGLVGSVSILMSSLLYADVLGGGDDRYIGLQMRIPFVANGSSLFSARVEYSALLITQNNGYKEGITFTQDIYGNQTMGYLRPSNTFHIGRSNISDYTMPIMTSNEVGVSNVGVLGAAVVVGVGVYVVGKVLEEVDDLVNCIAHESESDCAQDEDE